MSLITRSRLWLELRIIPAYSRWATSSGVSISRLELPITAFSGVRSSWLITARNSLLARLASIAVWRDSSSVRCARRS
jgi:hypothetical protein